MRLFRMVDAEGESASNRVADDNAEAEAAGGPKHAGTFTIDQFADVTFAKD